MEGSVNLSTLLSLGTTAAGVIGAMAVARYQIKSLTTSIEQIIKDIRKMDTRCDRLETQVETTAQRLGVISGMMSPEVMERRHREMAKLQADVASVRSEVEVLRHMHNGVHPPVPSERKV